MRDVADKAISASTYDRGACQVGVVHLGFGAFHRAHQAVYLDGLMEKTGDLRWGVAAVNLRRAEASQFSDAAADISRNDGYYLKSFANDGTVHLQKVRSHVAFADWTVDPLRTEGLLAAHTVHLVTITVTESGYYTDPDGNLDLMDELIADEMSGGAGQSIYAFLRKGLMARKDTSGAPLTVACCDNIRQNGKMLERNLTAYLKATGDVELLKWVQANVAFPCSMVDRITPRSPDGLADEMSNLTVGKVTSAIMAEDFVQWVLEDRAAGDMPDLTTVGVTVTPDVDPYEETKIRVLNGGHTALTYMAALEGLSTFDQAMRDPELREHFDAFEAKEVLPAITIDLPFGKDDYLVQIASRFSNRAIGDTVARICADGMAKFPIFIRPTLEGCLKQGILPRRTIESIASWHRFAQHVIAGAIPFDYVEPSWDQLKNMLGQDAFLTSAQLWGDIPKQYPDFAKTLRQSIKETELKWPV